MNIFDFKQEDLELNKRGQLSPRQSKWLKGFDLRIRSFSWIVGFLLLALSLVLALFLMNEGTYSAWFSDPANRITLFIIALGVIGILTMSMFLARRNVSGLSNAQLRSVEGNIHVEVSDNGHFVSIGNKNFVFMENARDLFQEGERYKIYYCKSGAYEFLMSYEKLYG